jgi:hypothetical protein
MTCDISFAFNVMCMLCETKPVHFTCAEYIVRAVEMVRLLPPEPPMRPASVTVLMLSGTSAAVAWTAPLCDGGAPLLHYVLEKREAAVSGEGRAASEGKEGSPGVSGGSGSGRAASESGARGAGARGAGARGAGPVAVRGGGGGGWEMLSTLPACVTECELENMAPGKDYDVRICAENKYGQGPYIYLPQPISIKGSRTGELLHYSLATGNYC